MKVKIRVPKWVPLPKKATGTRWKNPNLIEKRKSRNA